MEVYLDNSATTRPRDEVIDVINHSLKISYGNPSSLHRMGLEVEKKIKKSREIIGKFLGCKSNEIYFTASGTESNNIAIQGIVNKFGKRGNHIITTKIEHSSVINIFKHYENKGFKVTYLDVDNNGLIDLEELKKSITNETILVSIMYVNNEVGVIQSIKEIKDIIKNINKNALLHIDGIQAMGKINTNVKQLGCDTFSFSGHKIHGPKGIGGLYVKKDLNIDPIIFGGNQESGLRSGTENVPGILGLGKAVELLDNNFDEEINHILNIKKHFVDKITTEINNIKINSFLDNRCSPHILSISFIGTRGEVLLHYLEGEEIYVSTGSACSSKGKSKGKSRVLDSIGLSDKEIEGTIRFSFSHFNTLEQIDYAVPKIKWAVEEIRKIMG